MEPSKLVIVTRLTRLEESIRRYNTRQQVKFYIESRGQSFDDYELEYENYQRAREAVVRSIPPDLRFQIVDRSFLPNFLFSPDDLVLTLGQDGLVVNAAKYLDGQSILAVNPDPARFDGVLLPFRSEQVLKAIQALRADRLETHHISMARVDLNDGQFLHAFNDFFIGADGHISARYSVHYREQTERHSSSGIIVSTPAGSTGWLSSLYNMASGIQRFVAGKEKPSGTNKAPANKAQKKDPARKEDPPAETAPHRLAWDERKLVFMVREPFRSQWSQADLVAGELRENESLRLESHMPERGIIFSDGMEADFLEFNSGATAEITLARKTTNLLLPEHT
ncbi:MAG: NAD+ kinase [Spirochaetales bacterium]|nr:NAD+ kinase [Leptospiraceae bacterium]MCP5483152.1 NAD+ kinase [Spirochaetales bacterium]MCP5484592.1 NAD+ kinase [Spirochaetales bacterium]